MRLLFIEEDKLYLERKHNGLLKWVKRLDVEYDIMSTNQLRFMIDAGTDNESDSLPKERYLLLSSDRRILELAKEYGLPHAGIEIMEILNSDYILMDFAEVEREYLEKIYARQTGGRVVAFETKRCVLREIRLEDLDDLYNIYKEDSIREFMEPLFERAEEEEYTRAYMKNIYPLYDFGMWIVEDKETGEIIGRAGADAREFYGEMMPEIGYMISEKYQGKGLATEVLHAVLDYLAMNMEAKQAVCLVEERNRASVHLANKLGFELSKENEGHYTMDGKDYLMFVRYLNA